jgi:hypothetical protein
MRQLQKIVGKLLYQRGRPGVGRVARAASPARDGLLKGRLAALHALGYELDK